MITLNLKLSVLFIECEVKGALIIPSVELHWGIQMCIQLYLK